MMRNYIARGMKVACLMSALAVFSVTAAAEDWKRGQGSIDSVNSTAKTITIDDVLYHVPATCRIHRESGVKVPLSQLRGSVRADIALVPMEEVDFVRYEALAKGRGWVMVEITVLDRAME